MDSALYFVHPFKDKKRIPLNKTKAILLLAALSVLYSCNKTTVSELVAEPCQMQTSNPDGSSYESGTIVPYNYSAKHCGIIPLSDKNYWIYEDSLFKDGEFTEVRFDTLQYQAWLSVTDSLIWWQASSQKGLPEMLYANDSSVFRASDRLFTPGIKDARKEFGFFAGDSLRFLTSFDDAAAMGRLLPVTTTVETMAGSFDNCIYFDKNARNFRRDQLLFKPGIGVLKYIHEQAPMGTFIPKLQQVSTLISYHIE